MDSVGFFRHKFTKQKEMNLSKRFRDRPQLSHRWVTTGTCTVCSCLRIELRLCVEDLDAIRPVKYYVRFVWGKEEWLLGSGTLPLSFSTVQTNSFDCQVSLCVLSGASWNVRLRPKIIRFSPKNSPCMVFPPLKTITARKQLKITKTTPNSGLDATIEDAPLADAIIFNASAASDPCAHVLLQPRASCWCASQL